MLSAWHGYLMYVKYNELKIVIVEKNQENVLLFLKIICRKQDSMWQNLIIVIADEVSAMIDHAMKEIPAAALLYYYI